MRNPLLLYYETALKALGPQHWWPGETPFEVCVGAILTQNTNWQNVEKAIVNLKSKDLLDPHRIYALSPRQLAELIRPAGYFNIKTKRLRNFLKFLIDEYEGNLNRMFEERLETLREKLLNVSGIGKETADSILLYAGNKPVFVVDAYTKRILLRHEMIDEEADYDQVQEYLTSHLPEDRKLYNEFHALIVMIGKNFCKTKPDCERCPLKEFLPKA
ncbi:MAG: endonuclease III domain-containing protein [Deltaproteobacteria bacterium]|nr:endonuclease III domain-containing protein [Deltaproteobacteria bacterium]